MYFSRLALLCLQIIIFVANVNDVSAQQALQDVVDRLSQTVQELSQKYKAIEDRVKEVEGEEHTGHVVFTALIPDDAVIATSAGTVVPYANVLVNVGNAYNGATGVFTAPYDGDYYFALNTDVEGAHEGLDLRKNNVVVVSADHHDASPHVTTSAVISLKVGDKVTVNQQDAASGGYVEPGGDEVFTGFRIH